MTKVAVLFGGHGFIGSHLARQLMESGEYARVISADIVAQPRFRTAGVEYISCDVRAPISDEIAVGITEIYNLAAVHTTPGHEDWEYFWTNVLGASHVCDFARRQKVDNLIFTSSISVYGPSETAISEDTLPQPISAYGRSKFAAETIHHLWRHEAPEERRLIIARPAVIFGYTERGNYTRLAKLLKKGIFFYPGRKDTIKACGYVKDLVGSFHYFLKQPLKIITYNFVYTERFTVEQICHAFSEAAGYGAPRGVIPIWFMMMVGWFFEVLSFFGFRTSINRPRILKLFHSTNIIPNRLDKSGYARRFGLKEALMDWKNDSGGISFD